MIVQRGRGADVDFLLRFFSLFLIVVFGCGRTESAHDTSAPELPSPPYDLQWIDTVMKHHATAVEGARIAEGKATRSELLEMAATMRREETGEIAQLQAWRDQWYPAARNAYNPSLPGALSMKMDFAPLDAPLNESGKQWDRTFVTWMIPHQEAMLELANDAVRTAQHPELKRFAARLIPPLERDVATMRRWSGQWTR